MKHRILLISALLLTITGCQSISSYDEICGGDTTCPSLTGPIVAFKAEAMNTNTGQTYWTRNSFGYAGSQEIADSMAMGDCKYDGDALAQRPPKPCVITRRGSTVIYASLEDYKVQNADFFRQQAEAAEQRRLNAEQQRRLNTEQQRIRQAEYQRQRELRLEEERRAEKERMIAEMRERCASYGFSGDENIAACVQREAQHDLELAQQERALRLAQQRLANQSRQTQVQAQVVEEEVPWWMQFLADVVVGVAEGYEQNAIHNAQHKNDRPKVIYKNCPDNYVYC